MDAIAVIFLLITIIVTIIVLGYAIVFLHCEIMDYLEKRKEKSDNRIKKRK